MKSKHEEKATKDAAYFLIYAPSGAHVYRDVMRTFQYNITKASKVKYLRERLDANGFAGEDYDANAVYYELTRKWTTFSA